MKVVPRKMHFHQLTPDFEFCFRGFLGPLELMETLQEALTLV